MHTAARTTHAQNTPHTRTDARATHAQTHALHAHARHTSATHKRHTHVHTRTRATHARAHWNTRTQARTRAHRLEHAHATHVADTRMQRTHTCNMQTLQICRGAQTDGARPTDSLANALPCYLRYLSSYPLFFLVLLQSRQISHKSVCSLCVLQHHIDGA